MALAQDSGVAETASAPPPALSGPPPVVPTLPLGPPPVARTVDPFPEEVRQMMIEALANGNETEIATVAKYAIKAAPQAANAIQKMVDERKDAEQQAKLERLGNADFFALWKGKVELGGFRSTGSTDEFGITAIVSAKREGLKWTHAFSGSTDYRRASGKTSAERIIASYAPQYRFDDRGFVYGLAQYEHDPFIGYDSRFTSSVGIGYKLIDTDKVDLAIDVGPSLRHVLYTDEGRETKLGARTSANFEWKLSPTLTFRQTASGYAEKDVQSLTALSALDSRLISVLTARFSYNVIYETDTRFSAGKLDTLSRVSLIYEF